MGAPHFDPDAPIPMAATSRVSHSEDPESDPALAEPPLTLPERPGAALRQLVDGHLDFVWRALRRLGVLPGDVDDAAQRVFLIANEKLANIEPGRERSFLVGVAVRVASHARRSYQRRQIGEQRWSNPVEANPDPEQLTQELEARALLDRVLDGMPDELRAVFVLFELEELSIAETAQLLSLPRGTVATRLRRAREVFHAQARQARAQSEVLGGKS